MRDYRNKLYEIATALGLFGAMLAAVALLLDKSLPYRIGPEQYWRYLWSFRVAAVSLCSGTTALIIGIISFRGWRPIGLAFSPLAFLLFMGGIHSGPMPERWCYYNLMRIEDAKVHMAQQNALTNGTIVGKSDILSYTENRKHPLKCAVGGVYLINPVGVEPRCSIHGTAREMDDKRSRPKAQPVPSNPHSPSAQGADGR